MKIDFYFLVLIFILPYTIRLVVEQPHKKKYRMNHYEFSTFLVQEIENGLKDSSSYVREWATQHDLSQ